VMSSRIVDSTWEKGGKKKRRKKKKRVGHAELKGRAPKACLISPILLVHKCGGGEKKEKKRRGKEGEEVHRRGPGFERGVS